MKIISWLLDRFSNRRRILSVYRSGMTKAKRQDVAGAIADYTAVIQTPGVPEDIKAMAFYNRALMRDSSAQTPLAIQDLNFVLKSFHTPNKVRTEAKRKLVRMKRRDRDRGDHDSIDVF